MASKNQTADGKRRITSVHNIFAKSFDLRIPGIPATQKNTFRKVQKINFVLSVGRLSTILSKNASFATWIARNRIGEKSASMSISQFFRN
jgi:hypothetical protein